MTSLNFKGKSSVLCINLVDKKKEQLHLGKAFQDVVTALQSRMTTPGTNLTLLLTISHFSHITTQSQLAVI